PVARRRGYVHDDHGQDGLQLADDRVVEAAVRDRWCRGAHRSAPWFEAHRADAATASAHSRVDAPGTASWRDALVHAIAGPETGRAAHDRRPRVARRRPPTASLGALHALDGSRLRDESPGGHRALSRSTAARGRLLHRREDRDSGARSDRPAAAAVAGTSRTTWVRV